MKRIKPHNLVGKIGIALKVRLQLEMRRTKALGQRVLSKFELPSLGGVSIILEDSRELQYGE